MAADGVSAARVPGCVEDARRCLRSGDWPAVADALRDTADRVAEAAEAGRFDHEKRLWSSPDLVPQRAIATAGKAAQPDAASRHSEVARQAASSTLDRVARIVKLSEDRGDG